MTALDLLEQLQRLDIQVWLEGDRLRYRAPAGALTSSLRAELQQAKPELIRFLRDAAVTTQVRAASIHPAARDADLPLSFAQQRLWLLDQLDSGLPVYNLPLAIRLNGRLDEAAVRQSINSIVRRHEALRTAFVTGPDGQPVQVITPGLEIPLTRVDLSDVPEPHRVARFEALAGSEIQRTFDLGRVPLLRAVLYRVGELENILLVTMHHIISDGWSQGIWIKEFAQFYNSFLDGAGRPAPLPDLPVQYADFAVWQREWLQGPVQSSQMTFWQEQLRAPLPVLELALARPRPPVQTFTGTTRYFVLSQSVLDGLKRLAQAQGATLYMALLAAFQVLLYRYSGQTDIVLGSPVANRNTSEIEGLIGFFVNTLVLRTNLAGDPSFGQVLQRVREVVLQAQVHQDLPFEQLVQALNPERDLSRHPLFQIMFVLQNTPWSRPVLSDLSMERIELDGRVARFDLTLSVEETEQGADGFLNYNTDLFDAAAIERMVGHFQTLLQGILQFPDRSISRLPLLTSREQRQLLEEWNTTGSAPWPAECFHHIFEAQVRRTPDAAAVAFSSQVLTYDELDRRANQWAHFLRSLGVGPDVLVAICIERSLDLLVSVLAVLKAGGAYVPLDPSYPDERLRFILHDARVQVLLTQEQLAHRFTAPARVICVDRDLAGAEARPTENLAVPVSADHLAYVIYTSGSTGRPKGVMIPHRGLVNYLSWCEQAYEMAEGEGAPVHSSISFDLTITGLFGPLLAGRCVTMLPEELAGDALVDMLSKTRNSSLVKITPAHLDLLSERMPPDQVAGRTRRFIIGGEALQGKQLSFWQTNAPGTKLTNEYGPTETVVGCCVYEVPTGMGVSGDVPIGRPIANTLLYVLDKNLQPVPIGIPGELFIGGAGLARGYLNRPDLTADKFIPNPFATARSYDAGPGSRLYRTGDLARYREDGNLEFLGRTDDQVKIRGFRIELGEIKAVLREHPAVKDAAVLASDRESRFGPVKQLVAYFTARDPEAAPQSGNAVNPLPSGNGSPTHDALSDELRRWCKSKLPDYMTPAHFVKLAAIPLTANGKVDRRALPAISLSATGPAFVAPRTPVEKTVAEIWGLLLGIDRISVLDNFFELGGHSLLATRVLSLVRKNLGVNLTLRTIFEFPTLAAFAAQIDMVQAVQSQARDVRTGMGNREEIIL